MFPSPLVIRRCALGALIAALTVTPAWALTNPPTPVAATAGDGGPDCNTDISPTRADNGYLVHSATNLQRKPWQPRGGDIPFTIHVPSGFDTDATVHVCLRWHTTQGESPKFEEASARIDAISTTTHDPTIVATIPPLPPSPARWEWSAKVFDGVTEGIVLGAYTGLWLVPIADVRILVVDKTGAIKADIVAAVGVTAQWWAILMALLSVVVVFYILTTYCKIYMPHLAAVDPILRVITTAKGYGSLSQFQIVLWTFVVGASVIYVMSLSGDLIKISNGTLILLGISGAVALSSQLQSKQEDTRTKTAANGTAGAAGTVTAPAVVPAPTPAPPVTPAPTPTPPPPATTAATGATPAPGTAAGPPTATAHVTSWCDLIYDQGQIDVTRLQMLYFTVVMAVFVVMTVISQYEIPEIPESFLILMGISNGVYITAKFNK